MHRHHGHRYGYGRGFGHHWHPFRGFWLIGLAMFFLWGHWWPGILILVGLVFLLGTRSQAAAPAPPQNPPAPPVFVPPPAAPTRIPVQSESMHRTDLLPATCPHCGGPVRSGEVKWTGAQSAVCSYCG